MPNLPTNAERITLGPVFEPELIAESDACRLAGVSRSTLRKLEAAGDFPRRRVIPHTRSIRYVRGEVLAWVARIVAQPPAELFPSMRPKASAGTAEARP